MLVRVIVSTTMRCYHILLLWTRVAVHVIQIYLAGLLIVLCYFVELIVHQRLLNQTS